MMGITIPDAWCLPGGTVDDDTLRLPEQRQLPQFMTAVLMHNICKLQKAGYASFKNQNNESKTENAGTFKLLLETLRSSGVETLRSSGVDDASTEAWKQHFASILSKVNTPIYKGYCDDPRNTDQAWMETSVWHTHLPDFLGEFLEISEEISLWEPSDLNPPFRFRWIDVDNGVAEYRNLYASHYDFVELCVPSCVCGRRRFDQNDGSHTPRAASGECGARDDAASSVGRGLQFDSEFAHLQRLESDEAYEPASVCSPRSFLPATSRWKSGSRNGAACGQMQFLGNGTPSYFVRAGIETDDDILHARYLLNLQGLEPPDTLISVTGGAQDFKMDECVTGLVFSGLIQTALMTSACIVDGGTDAGVMKLLGEAVVCAGNRVDLLGVAGWGVIIGRESLDCEDADMAFYSKAHKNWHGAAGLDPNHGYFLLVDNGTAGIFETEIAARGKMESVLRDSKGYDDFKKLVKDTRELLALVHKNKSWPKEVENKLQKMRVNELIRVHQYSSLMDGKVLASAEAVKSALLRGLKARAQSVADEKLPLREADELQRYLRSLSEESENFRDVRARATVLNDLKVPHCYKCDGLYHDSNMPVRFRNSIPRTEYDDWFRIQSHLSYASEKNPVRCHGCRSTLSAEDVKKEKFHRCKQKTCDHYLFVSRCVDMRHRGRDHIVCDGCLSRSRLENILGKFVPAVLVVVEGGKGTILTAASTNAVVLKEEVRSDHLNAMLQSKERCTPIVVVEGSGRAADFIARTWRHMHEGDRRCHGCKRSSCVAFVQRFRLDGNHQRLLRASCPVVTAEHRRIFGDSVSDEERRMHVSWVIELCRRREAVTIYDPFKSARGIDFAIMRAICRGTLSAGKPLSMGEQLRMAIDWNLAERQVALCKQDYCYKFIPKPLLLPADP